MVRRAGGGLEVRWWRREQTQTTIEPRRESDKIIREEPEAAVLGAAWQAEWEDWGGLEDWGLSGFSRILQRALGTVASAGRRRESVS
jgi:hypothetical protein